MMRRKISTSGNSAALALSQDILGLMGVSVGDEVELRLIDRTLVVRPIDEDERDKKVAGAIENVVKGRRELMTRLAEGAGEPKARKKK